MNIIIVGGGKVGVTLVEYLNSEGQRYGKQQRYRNKHFISNCGE